MAGNSQRKGAKRTPGSKKGSVVGSGGAKSKGLRPKGPTPRAEDRTKAAKRSGSPGARTNAGGDTRSGGGARSFANRPGPRTGRPAPRRASPAKESSETV